MHLLKRLEDKDRNHTADGAGFAAHLLKKNITKDAIEDFKKKN